MVETLTYLGCMILAALTIFQAALILGAPLGRYAWGGKHAVLPTKLRIASVSSIILYVAFAVVLVSKAGVAEIIDNKNFIDTAMWVLTAYFIVGVLMNAASRSKLERNLMTPTALLLALVFLMVAAS